jgi:hypothetical protein
MRRTLPPDPPASGFRDTWFVRSRLDNVTIEVCREYVEREVIEQSRSELSTLLALFECGDPDLERVLLEVVATVSGAVRVNSRDAFMLDERSSLDTRAMMGEVRRRLERAVASGLVTVRRARLPRSPLALPTDDEHRWLRQHDRGLGSVDPRLARDARLEEHLGARQAALDEGSGDEAAHRRPDRDVHLRA